MSTPVQHVPTQGEEKGVGEEKSHGSDESDSSSGSGDGDGWGLLQRACLCYESGSFQGELDAFARKHAGEFEEAVGEEEKTGEHTHAVRYSDLHAQYLQLLESLLSDFLEKEGRTAEDLFSDMKDAKENNYTALFEEHEYHGFVQGLLAAMEYQAFYRLMLAAAAKSNHVRGGGSCKRGVTSARDGRCSSGDDGSVDGGGLDTGSGNGGGSSVSSVGRRYGEGDGERGKRTPLRK